MQLAARYTLFALIATALNLLSQELTLQLYAGPAAIYLAILIGTGTGLVSKYVLDKLYIFNVQTVSLGDDLSRFLAYSLTGVVTTLIFWGAELGFEFLFGTRTARYTGAVLGLGIGYLMKYRLDKRFVFTNRTL
jgi:putative flippase GtrA